MKKKRSVGVAVLGILNIIVSLYFVYSSYISWFVVSFCGISIPYGPYAEFIIKNNYALLMASWVMFSVFSIGMFKTKQISRRFLIFFAFTILIDLLLITGAEIVFLKASNLISDYKWGCILLIGNIVFLTRPKVKEQFK